MKLLEKEELGGIDSTSKTIDKWDELFKKVIPNLGYKEEQYDNIYPYESGIPMWGGEKMPVDPKSGRRFFRMSWADKLCGFLACYNIGDYSSSNRPTLYVVHDFMKLNVMALAVTSKEIFETFFPEAEEDDYEVVHGLVSGGEHERPYIAEVGTNAVIQRLWKYFIDNSIMYWNPQVGSRADNSSCVTPHFLTPEDKEKIFESERNALALRTYARDSLFIYYTPIENLFKSFPTDTLLFGPTGHYISSVIDKWRAFGEVYAQDYLCLSLNPIDKFMLSTKQAFSSCMSISKQNETRGTSSQYALCLPSILSSESVFLTFLTPGKHKNMYWEEEEWIKDPSDRDPDKAYKYLKMTCRALTYKGVPGNGQLSEVPNWDQVASEADEASKYADKNQERLFIGRQYSARGEDFMWQKMIDFLLALQGIATSITMPAEALYTSGREDISYRRFYDALMCGTLCDNNFFTVDKYGSARSVYLDNLRISHNDTYRELNRFSIGTKEKQRVMEKGGLYGWLEPNTLITIGSSRTGSGGCAGLAPKSGCDMFKLMMGEQDYSYLNQYVKICSECGKVVSADDKLYETSNRSLCSHCAEKLGVKYCPHCRVYYEPTPENIEKHKEINLLEYVRPNSYKDLEPKMTCKELLRIRFTEQRSYVLCAHCGEIHVRYGSDATTFFKEIEGISVRVGLCDACFPKAVMCDKCKKIIFLDEAPKPMLLLSGKRVVCPDCVDSVRMKKAERDTLKNLLDNFTEEDFEDIGVSVDEAQPLLQRFSEEYMARYNELKEQDRLYTMRHLNNDQVTKDIKKQIRSYKQGHPEVDFPEIAEPAPAVQVEEVVF